MAMRRGFYYRVGLIIAAALLLLILGALVWTVRARMLDAWPMEDYFYFRESASMLVNGVLPYTRPRLFYPLPTVVWFFVPLLAGEWTRWVWLLMPLVFLHLVLGRKAILLWGFYPVLVHLRFGQVDGWLILPIYALLTNTMPWAGLGAGLIILKPQTALLLVLYRLAQWVRERRWRILCAAGVTALLLVLPAFLLFPGWVDEWLKSVAAHPAQECQNATIWGWTCFGNIGVLFALAEGALAVVFLLRATDRARAIQSFGLLITPILYAYDYILVPPTLKTWQECAILTCASWLALGIDIAAGGWGGAYSLIPLTGLFLRTDWAQAVAKLPVQMLAGAAEK